MLVKVKKRKRDPDGNLSGTPNQNTILDTRVYKLEFPDGRLEEYAVNIIAENLLNQADNDVWDTGFLEEFIDIRKDPDVSIPISKGYIASQSGQRKAVITTKGWDV